MRSFTFRWPGEANEVFVSGTFDDWGKTIQLEKRGDVFEKEVQLPSTNEKIQYKFVVDGIWLTDSDARQENDGNNNINNVLLPEDLTAAPNTDKPEFLSLAGGNTAAAVMAGVTPESTTAQLAGGVAKETKDSVPGGFPETPNELSVNPIPATNGIGNPVKLNPGDPLPDPSTLHSNTVESTVRTDKEAYEADASNPVIPNKEDFKTADALEVPPQGAGLVPESSLPQNPPQTTEPGFTIQSAHPTSTTAALAAQVPLESQKGAGAANDVPEVVQQSLSKAHETPEAAANAEAVEEKANVEKELQDKVAVTDGPAAVPAPEVPGVVKDSLEQAHQDPEAAASKAVVGEKKEVEQELQQKVPTTDKAGEPAPTTTAATTSTAPVAATTDNKPIESAAVSPQSKPPPTTAAQEPATTTQTQPTVTTGVAAGQSTAESKPVGGATQDIAKEKEKKKKNRASGFFQKLKEKLK